MPNAEKQSSAAHNMSGWDSTQPDGLPEGAEICPACGALPCDWGRNPHPPSGAELPTWEELAGYWKAKAEELARRFDAAFVDGVCAHCRALYPLHTLSCPTQTEENAMWRRA